MALPLHSKAVNGRMDMQSFESLGDLERHILDYVEPLPDRSREPSVRNLSNQVENLLAGGLTANQMPQIVRDYLECPPAPVLQQKSQSEMPPEAPPGAW